MKRKKLIAGCLAILLTLLTVIAPIDTAKVKAATVTDKPMIDLVFKNEVGKKQLTKEDAEAFAKEFGYDTLDGEFVVCNSNTSGQINWNNSVVPYGEVYDTWVFAPIVSRDKNGKLVVERDEDGYIKSQNNHSGLGGWSVGQNGKIEEYSYCEDSYFDMRDPGSKDFDRNGFAINNHLGNNWFLDFEKNKKTFNDFYIIRFYYTMDGKGNLYTPGVESEGRQWGYTDCWILPEASLDTTILHFEEEEDPTPVEQHIVELPENKTSLSSSELTALLQENQTKDVVIKSNNNVTFTFKKGTMDAVDGKDSYDFSTTLNTTYSTDLPYYATQDNFVSQIDYNYSGKLPGQASIRFYVGNEYAGQTLYYSLLNENKTYAEVQKITVDSEGYMTVKQDHCSSYIVTKDNPETKFTATKVKLGKNSVVYNGKAQKPSVKVYDGDGNVIPAGNYTVSYKNNKNVGKATVTVKMTGNYQGTLTTSFTIAPKSTKVVSLASKKNAFTVKWSKQATQTTGYQLQYATNKNFKGAKNVFVNNTKTVNKTVSKLKAKQTYYVRVRTYKVVKVNGKNTKIYSNWSPAKKVVTKK